jgi:hypothetical protein
MNRLSIVIIALLCTTLSFADTKTVASPDGKLIVSIDNTENRAYYSVKYNNKPILERSALGLYTDIGNFADDIEMVNSSSDSINDTYSMTRSKFSKINYKANVLNINYKNKDGHRMTITFSVADNSVAYRYSMPIQGETKCAVIKGEASSFRFPEQTTTFLCPINIGMTGWSRDQPSYEEEYNMDAAMTDKSKYGEGYSLPCLFHIGDNGWALVCETGVTSQYCGSHLSDYSPEKGYTVAFPQQAENNFSGSTTAAISLPGSTPWRTIAVGDNLKPIVETTVQFDVVKPLYEASQVYKHGRGTWSWILWQDNSINYNDQKTFVDLASALGWEYVLVDNYWYTRIGRDKIKELADYARTKNVDLFLWYNSNGAWNDAPQDPRNLMNTSITRKAEMKWMKSIGVKGIKVDFFGGDKQETMRLYEDILSDANDAGLMVVFHGCTIPRGWERMFPNYASSEAVRASENMMFTQRACDREGMELTLHPFLRNAIGVMDFGGTFLNHRISKDNKSGHIRRTTDVFELATTITNQSGFCDYALGPNNLTDVPSFEIDLMKKVPAEWDETRFIDGYPGHYIVLARRSGDKWYLAALNGTDKTMKVSIPLDMFSGATANMYIDGNKKKGEEYPTPLLKQIKLDKKAHTTITLQPLGGAVITNE